MSSNETPDLQPQNQKMKANRKYRKSIMAQIRRGHSKSKRWFSRQREQEPHMYSSHIRVLREMSQSPRAQAWLVLNLGRITKAMEGK